MRTILFAVAITCVIACVYADTVLDVLKSLPAEDLDKICDQINHKSHSLVSPIRCRKNVKELGLSGEKFLANNKVDAASLNPVVLLPGLGGSVLEAILDKSGSPFPCYDHYDKWFRIWFAIEEVLVQPCWFDNLDIEFNATTGNYTNTPGVQLRPKDFGGVDGVNYLTQKILGFQFGGYYDQVIATLEKVGYVAGQNLHGAPYDWRYPATFAEKIGWMAQLQQLIETTYSNNGNLPVHIVTHSMGGPTGLYFLQSMTQAWRDQYVASFFPIAGPWSGAPNALRAVISGDNFGLSVFSWEIVKSTYFMGIARKSGGVMSLVPNPDLNSTKAIFVYTPTKNYTLEDFPQLFQDINSPISQTVWENTNLIVESLTAPNVPVYCSYGTGTPTEVAYTYPKGFTGDDKDWNDQVVIDESDLGDGTVPLYSLQECQIWNSKQTEPVEIKEFDLRDHGGILEDDEFLQYLLSVVTKPVASRG